MGCVIAGKSTSRASCKDTCMATRSHQPGGAPDQWSCEFHFAPANATFNMCGKCPSSCPPCVFCGVKVMDYECEQGCDLSFGCSAAEVLV